MPEYNCFECQEIPGDCSYLPYHSNVSCQWRGAAEEMLRRYYENIKIMPHEQAIDKNVILTDMLIGYLKKQKDAVMEANQTKNI